MANEIEQEVGAIVTLLEAREWTDTMPKTALAQRLEDALHDLHEELREAQQKAPISGERELLSEQGALALVGAVRDQAQIPEGYTLVPIEPTNEMLVNVDEEVGGSCYSCSPWRASDSDCRRVYAAMLEAAPAIRALKGTPAAAVADAQPACLENAWRAGWAACRDAEYVGKEAENDAWHSSQTFRRASDIADASPQPSSNPGPLAAVERDAENYRFLRDRADPDDGPFVMDAAGNDLGMGETLDAAIRAAIAASKEGASHE